MTDTFVPTEAALELYVELREGIERAADDLLLRYLATKPNQDHLHWSNRADLLSFSNYEAGYIKYVYVDRDQDEYNFSLPASYLWDTEWETKAIAVNEAARKKADRDRTAKAARDKRSQEQRERTTPTYAGAEVPRRAFKVKLMFIPLALAVAALILLYFIGGWGSVLGALIGALIGSGIVVIPMMIIMRRRLR